MDKHDKAELVGQLAEARASLAAAMEENRSLREEAAAAAAAASRGPGLFPDSPSSGEEEQGAGAADVAAMREAASSLRGAAKVRVALGASLEKTSKTRVGRPGSAGVSTGTTPRTTATAFGVPVPPNVAEAVDELVQANEAMRAEIGRLATERDALKAALGESTRARSRREGVASGAEEGVAGGRDGHEHPRRGDERPWWGDASERGRGAAGGTRVLGRGAR